MKGSFSHFRGSRFLPNHPPFDKLRDRGVYRITYPLRQAQGASNPHFLIFTFSHFPISTFSIGNPEGHINPNLCEIQFVEPDKDSHIGRIKYL